MRDWLWGAAGVLWLVVGISGLGGPWGIVVLSCALFPFLAVSLAWPSRRKL